MPQLKIFRSRTSAKKISAATSTPPICLTLTWSCAPVANFASSNFLLWQMAYSEIYVTDRFWPDFRGIHLLEAIADYQRRERRYGGLNKRQESDGKAPIPDSFLVPR